jgi:rhodanese-related sulfurtransferase
MIPAMTVQQLKAMIDDGVFARGDAVLLDVREPHELAVSGLPDATHVPMRQLPGEVDKLDRAKRYAVLCRVGGRSAQVTAFLRQHGFDAVNITGGINAYAREVDATLKAY